MDEWSTFGTIFDHVSLFSAVEAGSASSRSVKVSGRVASFGSASALEAASSVSSFGEVDLDLIAEEVLSVGPV